jgi:hypothetical protein
MNVTISTRRESMHCAADFAFKRLQSDIENDAGLNFWNQCDPAPLDNPSRDQFQAIATAENQPSSKVLASRS